MEQQLRLNISLDQTQEVLCDSCNKPNFINGFRIRKASGLLTGTGQTSYIPIPVFICNDCGNVNQEFLPKEVQGLD